MTRQEQNIILGGLACAVLILAAAAVYVVGKEDGNNTAAVAPLGGVTQAADLDGGLGGADDQAGGSTLVAPSSTVVGSSTTALVAPTTTVAPPSSTAAPVTEAPATTQAASATTEAPAVTEAPTTTEAVEATTTVAEEATTTTEAEAMTDTTVEETTTTVDSGGDPEPTPAPTTVPEGEETTTTVEAPPATDPPADSTELNAVEREIARLTNELRTNPNGPLARQGPVIDCGGRVRVDSATNTYEPIGAVEVNLPASLQVARPWSAQMTRDNFEHQPNAGVPALQAAGIDVWAAGENIAWHTYPDKAMTHFTGWRESDGHFCNMMDPEFTFLGVGEVTKDGVSYATQNFFSTR